MNLFGGSDRIVVKAVPQAVHDPQHTEAAGSFQNDLQKNFAFDPKNSKWQDSVQLKNKLGVSELAITAVMRFSYAAARGAKYPPMLCPESASRLGSTSLRDNT